jgi:UDP-N-acetylmuramate dehydrogenase
MPTCIKKNVPLAPHTTLNIGGCAEYFVEITDEDRLDEVLLWARENHIRITVLGGGSNVLISDNGIRGLVIKMSMRGIMIERESDSHTYVRVSAGESWDDFVAWAVAEGLWGVENLSGIPGSVGASPVQNINAYGATVSEVIESVSVQDSVTGKKYMLSNSECKFAYRDSFFKSEVGKMYIITNVLFKLVKEKKVNVTYKSSSQSIKSFLEKENNINPTPSDIRRAVLHARKNIGMLLGMVQSAGSFFKNVIVTNEEFMHLDAVVSERYSEKSERLAPWHWSLPDGKEKVSTAFLMECTQYNKASYKDKTFNGTVGISPFHTLSIINCGGAHASDVTAFSSEIISEVRKEFGVTIEREVCYME